ncbi:MAG: hypothetical protein K2K82_01195, partial [Muribaculaceae bacterium]|nr:hypothetical protein [Muribaculaceae bacterium]
MQALELPQLADRLAASADSSRAESTRRARRQALNLFRPCLEEEITERNVSLWALKMQGEGYSVSTIAFYLKVISAMFTEIGESTEVFSSVRHRMADAGDSSSIEYDSLRRMISELSADVPSNSLGGDLTLMAVLGGGLDSKTLLSLEFDKSFESIEPLQNIIEKYSRPRAKKIFPLTSQRDIQLRIRGVLRRYGLQVSADALWTGAALKAGISPEEILSVIVHRPSHLSLLSLFQPLEADKIEILERVADYLADNPYRWFAMQLRRGEDFETIAELSGLAEQNLYYPSREVKRRVGRRMITQERAFLPGIVFFRARQSDVAPLLRKIGSRAWVYRQTASPRAPYAVISPAEMIAFQLAVGVLIDHTTASTDMRPGDTVEIIGGHFRGLLATI